MINRFLFATLALLTFCNITNAQNNYWQQRVNHKINVTLDDKNHVLRGNEMIVYENHSPDTLRFIYIQLYPNAYSSKTTAFAKEQIRTGDLTFRKAKPEQMGFIDSLSFTANNKPAQLEPDAENPDYAKLILPEPLVPNEAVILNTPFRYKLNHTFSRGGHVGQSYQISQWFPKPSVYDKNGWHPMPYLENGEYYAEFGDYEVNITLPANYLIGATGNLQNTEEKNWLTEQAAAYEKNLDKTAAIKNPAAGGNVSSYTEPGFPASDISMKTLKYLAWNVQDFAWFADKRFYVLKSEVELHSDYNGWKEAGNKKVESWVFFHSERRKNLWRNAHRYVDSSLYYYSKWIGHYAHDQATAVEGALVAGGGMEYPNVTVIGDMPTARLLENVIAHEVGHNWFQGMLGSNERDHPWMDEGINSYYEQRYMEATRPLNSEEKRKGLQATIDAISNIQDSDLPYLYQARRNYEQPVCSRAPDLTTMNIGIMVYMKTPLIFDYLESYIGTKGVDTLIQKYFQQYRFKHPQPADIRRIFDSSGVELDWLFDDLLCNTKHVDYKLTSTRGTELFSGGANYQPSAYHKIGIKNKGGVKGPYSISAYDKNGTVLSTQRYGGFLDRHDVLFPYDDRIAAFRIDAEERMPEYRRQDNTMRTKGILRSVEPVKFRLFTGLETPYRTTINVAPAIGYNLYDGFQLGLALHNFRVPMNNFEWAVVPMYATQRGGLSGLARIQGYVYPKGLQHIRLSAMGSQFGYDKFKPLNDYLYFQKVTPSIEVRFKTPFHINSRVTTQYFFTTKQAEFGHYGPDNQPHYYGTDQHQRAVLLKYTFDNTRPINPFGFNLGAGFYAPGPDSYYLVNGLANALHLTAFANYRISYSKRKGLDSRFFFGYSTNNSHGSFPMHVGGQRGYDDYTFSHYFIGRSETTTQGIAGQQVILNEGGLKFVSPENLIKPYGVAQCVTSVNLKSSLPVPLLFVFADAAYTPPLSSLSPANENQWFYDAGVGLKLIPNVCEIYLPLLFSDDLKTQVIKPYRQQWYERIVFTLQFENLDPFKLIREINVN